MNEKNWCKEIWQKEDYAELVQTLQHLAEDGYRNFHANLVPGIEDILGVRLPILKKIAKEIAKGNYRSYLALAQSNHYEEIMLQGLVIGFIKTDIDTMLALVADFVPKIHCWSVCDSFASGLHLIKKHKEKGYAFLQPYAFAEEEYEIRFAFVMLMDYFMEEAYLQRIFALIEQAKKETYYVKMAIAWLLSVAYIKFPGETLAYLQKNTLDDFTYRKALQKIIESNRVSDEDKNMMRQMKKR